MRVSSYVRSGDVCINMTPMIDVVFQLLIFFLVSSHLVKQEAQMALPLPVAESGQMPGETEIPRLTVNVLNDGQLRVAGRHVVAEELTERLQKALASEGKNLEVRIRSDRAVPYEKIEPILLSCAQAGVWNVAFAVHSAKDVP